MNVMRFICIAYAFRFFFCCCFLPFLFGIYFRGFRVPGIVSLVVAVAVITLVALIYNLALNDT